MTCWFTFSIKCKFVETTQDHRRFELSRGFISILRQKIGDAGVRVVCRIHRVRFYVRPPVAALWAISIHSSRHATISIKYLTHLTRNVKLLSNWEPHIHATQIRITKYACVCIHCNIYIFGYTSSEKYMHSYQTNTHTRKWQSTCLCVYMRVNGHTLFAADFFFVQQGVARPVWTQSHGKHTYLCILFSNKKSYWHFHGVSELKLQ